MKHFLKNVMAKRICTVLLIVILMSNFIMPNYVCASAGAKLVSGFFYLIAYIGDKCIEIMQDMMVGDPEIKNGDTYEIKYSPGVIFSNNVLALDINFISPNTTTLYTGEERKEETSIISSNTYTANRSGGMTSSEPSVVYEGVSNIGASGATHTKGERRYSRKAK